MTAETDPSKSDRPPDTPPDDDGDNEIGFRNVDEEAEHDERGSQGPGALHHAFGGVEPVGGGEARSAVLAQLRRLKL
jgi:hypothetical protein